MTQTLWRSSVAPALSSCSMHTVSPLPAVACVFRAHVSVSGCVCGKDSCIVPVYCDRRWMAVVVVPVALNSPLGLATSALLPLVGVVFCFFGAFFLSFYQCKPHGHAIMLPFTLLHGRPYYNPPHTVSVYHLFSSLWIIQKNIFHIRTLSLLLLHFLSLYLSNHSPHLSLSGVMVPTVV